MASRSSFATRAPKSSLSSPFFATALLAFAAACGGAPPAPPATAKEEVKPVTQSVPEVVKPQNEPDGVIATLRWKNPAETVMSLASAGGVPADMATEGVRSLLRMIGKDAVHGSEGAAFADLVAADAPLDMLLLAGDSDGTSEPKPGVIVSIGLSSFERAKALIQKSGKTKVSESGGVIRLGDDDACVLTEAKGKAPGRVICTDESTHARLGEFTGYLARDLPLQPSKDSDIRGEIRLGAIDKRFGLRKTIATFPLAMLAAGVDNKILSNALMDAADALRAEALALLGDVAVVGFDLKSDPAAGLSMSVNADSRSTTSWTLTSVAMTEAHAGPAPGVFWRLPKDATSASYSNVMPAERFDGMRKALIQLVDGGLDYKKVPAADRKAVSHLLEKATAAATISVLAQGGPDTLPKGASPFLSALSGWSISGSDQPAAVSIATLKEFVAVYNRASLQSAAKKALEKNAVYVPTIKLLPTPKELGKDGLAIEVVLNLPETLTSTKTAPPPPAATRKTTKTVGGPVGVIKEGPPKTTKTSIYLFVTGDGTATWTAFGADKKSLFAHLAIVKSGTPDQTLATRTDLESLKTTKWISGGFGTFLPLINMVTNTAGASAYSGIIQNLVRTLPHKGEAPMFHHMKFENGRLEYVFSIPKAPLEDVGTIVTGAASLAQAFGGTP